MPTSDYAVQELVSASGSALASCSDVKGERDTHVERCVRLHVCNLERRAEFQHALSDSAKACCASK